jgi:phosphoglycolate phosphatase-like HAD superfamily hydrolase
MTKEFYNIEVINIVPAINKILEDANKTKDMPIKFRWNLKKNLEALSSTVNSFNEFKQELVDELQKEYFNEEKSHEETMETEEGTQEFRKINDEYMDEYKEHVNELNKKLEELLSEKSEYEICTVNMDEFVNGLSDDTALEFADIELLSFMGE